MNRMMALRVGQHERKADEGHEGGKANDDLDEASLFKSLHPSKGESVRAQKVMQAVHQFAPFPGMENHELRPEAPGDCEDGGSGKSSTPPSYSIVSPKAIDLGFLFQVMVVAGLRASAEIAPH